MLWLRTHELAPARSSEDVGQQRVSRTLGPMRPRRRSRFNFVNGVASAPSGCHQPKMRLRASATDTAAPLPSPSSPLLGLLKARSHLRSGLSGAAAQTLAVEPLLIATRSVPRQAADKADPDRPTSDANDRDVSAEPLLIREATRPWKPRMTCIDFLVSG